MSDAPFLCTLFLDILFVDIIFFKCVSLAIVPVPLKELLHYYF